MGTTSVGIRRHGGNHERDGFPLEQLRRTDEANGARLGPADGLQGFGENRIKFWHWLTDLHCAAVYSALGFRPAKKEDKIGGIDGEVRPIEVHSVRLARRVSAGGSIHSDVVFEITQTFRPAGEPNARIRGGCTLIVDLPSAIPRYLIRKRLEGPDGVAKQFGFHLQIKSDGDDSSLQSNYYDTSAPLYEPFALLHGRH